MEFSKVKKGLQIFANTVIKQAKGNLRRHRNNHFITGSSTGNLEGSLGYDLKVMPKSFSLEFFMDDYGMFQDEGVRGKKSTYSKSKNSRFSFKNKMPPPKSLDSWIKRKGIEGNIKSLRYVIAKSIFEKGLRASFFFTKPFENAYLKLPDEIIEKFALDIDELLDFTT
tara:strand:- start:238 stop:741 length:504 start_codon:yes stop_codon:yes gene_type:complete